MGTQIILVYPYRTDTATQFCLTSNPVFFQLLKAVNCEKEKKKQSTKMIQGITAPGGSWLLFQHNQKDQRKGISNMENATSLVVRKSLI